MGLVPSLPPRLLTSTFAAISLLSAFLLFEVQPIVSNAILPWFGGSPGVWTTCMLFFQVVLFLGYSYAHWLGGRQARLVLWVHGSAWVAACLLLPIEPDAAWKPAGHEAPEGRILLLLLSTVGLPYFLLASTSPLIQAWFARHWAQRLKVQEGRAPSPWRLYALSNAGSLVALLSYPFWIEPSMDLGLQVRGWSVLFVIDALLMALLMIGVVRGLNPTEGREAVARGVATASLWRRRLLWLLLPAVASSLLLATSNHVSQDVAVVPLMWVVPLALYLLSFMICFDREGWYHRGVWVTLALPVLAVVILEKWIDGSSGWNWDPTPNYLHELLWCFAALFLACVVCHGELVRLKPVASRLTEFYLWMSAGGALGGLLVSLVAPHTLSTYLEWPLGLLAAFGVCLVAVAAWLRRVHQPLLRQLLPLCWLGFGGWGLWFMGRHSLVVDARLERVRNFYGAVNVDESHDGLAEGVRRTLTHGGIIHGVQDLGDRARQEPSSYYGRHTGFGQAMSHVAGRGSVRVGIIGMGAGTSATYARNGEVWRFYEINPAIPRLARKHFTFLSDAVARGARVETVLGDARLMLEREPAQRFDVLLLDAFSGDAIPVHLLTREAFAIYRRHLKEDGILVAHITNSYLALAPVVEGLARDMAWGVTRTLTDEQDDHDTTDYMMLSRDLPFLERHPRQLPPVSEPKNIPLWTDRRHNLFEILMTQ